MKFLLSDVCTSTALFFQNMKTSCQFNEIHKSIVFQLIFKERIQTGYFMVSKGQMYLAISCYLTFYISKGKINNLLASVCFTI